MHLGQASQFLIYGPKNGTVSLIGTRPAPAAGSGPARWDGVAEITATTGHEIAIAEIDGGKLCQAAGKTTVVAKA